MKKMTTLVAVILMTAASTFGQGFGLGLKGGLNFAKIDISNASASTKTGFHFGAFAKLMLTKKIGIQPEAYYSVQGSELTAGAIKSEISTNYLQVPVLLRYNPISIINFHVGPQFGILLKAEDETGGVTTDIKDDLKNGDVALAVGAGLDLPMGLSLALRYVKGISDVSEASESDKSNMFQVSIGYQLIGLGK